LFMFWPTMTPKSEDAQFQAEDGTISSNPGYEVKLAWSELRHATWAPQRSSLASMNVAQLFDSAIFRLRSTSDGLQLFFELPQGVGQVPINGTDQLIFYVPYPNAEPLLASIDTPVMPAALPDSNYWMAGQLGKDRLSLPSDGGTSSSALKSVKGFYYLVGPGE